MVVDYVKYSYSDLSSMEAAVSELRNRIEKNTFVFDQSTIHYQYVNLGRNENLKEVVFKTPQPNLIYLDLGRCNLTKLIIPEGCNALTTLYANGNQLQEISFMGDCPMLQLLDVSHNQLTKIELPFHFPKLKFLYLDKNRLENLLSISSFLLRKQLDFSIQENDTILVPPAEIVQRGKLAVRNVLEEYQAGIAYMYEAKLLILGEERAGKTSLSLKLKQPDADISQLKSTDGIDVSDWKFPRDGKEMKINIWDFAGQMIYSFTHRFFLTNRSLYVVLGDERKGATDFFYWLHITQMFGGNSPVLIVINEKDNRPKEIEEYSVLRAGFENLKERYNVNLINQDQRFDKLIKGLKSYLAALPHIGTAIPSIWMKVRSYISDLESKGVKAISIKDFRDECAKIGIKDNTRQITVSNFFHDIGVFLHFTDDDVLSKTIFINKDWILNAAYLVIDTKEIEEKKGRFNKEDIKKWLSREYEDYRAEIIALMKRFYLIYEKDGYYIAPQKLPSEIDGYHWVHEENILFEYQYPVFMPQGILWQFIVEMKDLIKEQPVWKYGVVLQKEENTFAEITESRNERRIKIRVSGAYKEDFRGAIIDQIDRINAQYHKLIVEKKLPCVCASCKQSNTPYFHSYDVVMKAKESKQESLQCQKSFEQVPLPLLLSGFKIDEKASKKADTNEILQEIADHLKPKEAKKTSKVKFVVKLGITILLLVGFVVLSVFYPQYIQAFIPIGLAAVVFINFWDKFLSMLDKLKK